MRDPIEGGRYPQALYLSIGQEVSFTPLRVDWHLAIRVSPPRITQEHRLKPLGQDLTVGISPCLVLWKGACPYWLLPAHGNPSSTQILTQYCSAKSQTTSQLTNQEPRRLGKSPLFSPSGLSKYPRAGLVRMRHHFLTTQMEL
jgi:hypothetical protein